MLIAAGLAIFLALRSVLVAVLLAGADAVSEINVQCLMSNNSLSISYEK